MVLDLCCQRQPLRRVLEQPVSCRRYRPHHNAAGAGIRLAAPAHRLSRQGNAAPAGNPADHHAALRYRLGDYLAIRPQRRRHRDGQRSAGHPAEPLDLWLRRAAAGANAGIRADRLSGADRCRRRHQPLDGGSGTDIARRPLAHISHRDLAAAAAGTRQCFSHRLCREPGRFRQSPRARRQFRCAVDRYLLRHRRLAERSRPRRRPVDCPVWA